MQYETKVRKIIQRTHNVKSFQFNRHQNFNYKPGQFFFITIKINGKKNKKHFTISSNPTQPDFLEFTKKLTGHEFSNGLDELKEGDWINIDGPYGNFTFKDEFKKVGMLTGGIGITPLRSIIGFCNTRKINSNIILLYSNRTQEDIVFKEEFERINKENPKIKIIFTLTHPNQNWNGYNKRIDKEIILKEIPDYEERIFFTCGPPKLVENMTSILELAYGLLSA